MGSRVFEQGGTMHEARSARGLTIRQWDEVVPMIPETRFTRSFDDCMRAPQTAKKKNASSLRITLGRSWQPYVAGTEPDAELLGTVSRGAQIGALARLRDGRYMQVNGDWMTPLNGAKVEHALRKARILPQRPPAQARPSDPAIAPPEPIGGTPAAPAAPVVVRVRKRRVAVLPPAQTAPSGD